jgi:acyl carrier protein
MDGHRALISHRGYKEHGMGNVELSAASIKSSLRTFLTDSVLPLARIDSFADGDSFLEKGILDSTGVLELVGHLEKQYAIRVEADEITPDNLDSLDKLAAFVSRKAVGGN